jgi:hypothetical protein
VTASPPWGNTPDPGAYGHIKIAEILYALPEAEGEEYDRLTSGPRSDEAQVRIEELWNRAKELHRASVADRRP